VSRTHHHHRRRRLQAAPALPNPIRIMVSEWTLDDYERAIEDAKERDRIDPSTTETTRHEGT